MSVLHDFPASEMAAMVAPARTLLLVIDVQNDFAAPSGAMGQAGADLTAAAAAIGRIAALIEAARAAGVSVGFTRCVTTPETDSVALRNFTWRTGQAAAALAICREGSAGAEYHRVRPLAGELEVEKLLYSSFAGTDLALMLRERGIDTLVVTGLTSSCCVDCTVRDAFHQDFNVFVAADGCADYNSASHAAALAALGMTCAVVVDSATVLAGWQDAASDKGGVR